jgi:hypothetical protein
LHQANPGGFVQMNSFWLSFLDASVFAGLFVGLFLFGLYVVSRVTRTTASVTRYDWDKENLGLPGVHPGPIERPRLVRPRENSPQLEL